MLRSLRKSYVGCMHVLSVGVTCGLAVWCVVGAVCESSGRQWTGVADSEKAKAMAVARRVPGEPGRCWSFLAHCLNYVCAES